MKNRYTVVVLGIADDGDMLQGAYNAASFDTEEKARFSMDLGFKLGGHAAFLIDNEQETTESFKKGTENIRKAIKEMEGYLNELCYAGFSRRKEIRKEAVTCDQLMTYSYEVADTDSKSWKKLYELVGRIMLATDGDYLLE